MSTNYQNWLKLFLFCLGLFIASAFCMKWMESGLQYYGKKFTVIGLEISYSKERLMTIFSGIDEHVRTILRYHLNFDFVFMAGVYPGIAALCILGSYKTRNGKIKTLLSALALLQGVAWGCDVAENLFLLKWIKTPSAVSNLGLYHGTVWTKWVLALTGAALSIPFAVKKSNRLLIT